MEAIKQEFNVSYNQFVNQSEIIVDLRTDVAEDLMQIEGLIEGVKKKIVLAD